MAAVLIPLALWAHLAVAQTDFFWQLNDLHYDPTYSTHQESCNLHIPSSELGPYGHPECDAPWKLVERAIVGMAIEGRYPKFIMWSG